MRWVLGLLLWVGCDRVFGLDHVHALDAAPPDGALPVIPDAPPGIGCSSGQRAVDSPGTDIAACAGSWKVAGMDRTGSNSAGAVCEVGWHVCIDKADAVLKGAATLCPLLVMPTDFYATAQKSSATDQCDGGGNDDVFGCGGFGFMINCGPLTRAIGTLTPKMDLGAWDVGADGSNERENVIKGPGNGGVLCCTD